MHPQQHQQARSPHQPQILDIDAFILQTMISGEAWKRQIEESNRKAAQAEQHLAEAYHHIITLTDNLMRLSCCLGDSDFNSYEVNDLRGHMLPRLRYVQAKLRGQLEAVDKAVFLETSLKCIQCEKNNRELLACNHLVLCGVCAITQRECPYCSTPGTH